MRLFGKPGGTRSQLRAALLTIPFDLSLVVIPLVADELWQSDNRPTRWQSTNRGTLWQSDNRPTRWQTTEEAN